MAAAGRHLVPGSFSWGFPDLPVAMSSVPQLGAARCRRASPKTFSEIFHSSLWYVTLCRSWALRGAGEFFLSFSSGFPQQSPCAAAGAPPVGEVSSAFTFLLFQFPVVGHPVLQLGAARCQKDLLKLFLTFSSLSGSRSPCAAPGRCPVPEFPQLFPRFSSYPVPQLGTARCRATFPKVFLISCW